MATLFLESGTDATQGLEFYSAVVGTVASDTAQSKTGPRALKCSTGAGSAAAYGRVDGILADAGRRISFYLRFGALPTATCNIFGAVKSGDVTFVFGVQVTSAGVLQIGAAGVTTKTGSTLSASTWYHISVPYLVTSSSNFTIKCFLNGVSDSTMTNADGTLTNTASSVARFGWGNGSVGANKDLWIDDISIDDSAALTDPGDIRVTAKLPNTVNNNTWNTTGGTGAVNERPLSETNYKEETGTSAVYQDYTLQNAATGDVDITDATIVSRTAWVWSKISATGGGAATKLVDSGTDNAITLTTSPALYTVVTTSASYPSSANGLGMKSSGAAGDTFFYEGGTLIAFLHPITRLLSPAGTITSAGVLTKSVSNHLSGGMASIGALAKTASKPLTGAIASAGALVASAAKTLNIAGTITSAGVLTKSTAKNLAGTITSAGVLTKKVTKNLAGTITSAGALVNAKTKAINLSGTITSAGVLAKTVSSHLSGAIASSGALTAAKNKTLSIAGTITSSGALTKKVTKNLAGTLTSAGVLSKSVSRHLAGSIASAGILTKTVSRHLAGSIASAGTLVNGRILSVSLSGTITSAGVLAKRVSKNVSGSIASSGIFSSVATITAGATQALFSLRPRIDEALYTISQTLKTPEGVSPVPESNILVQNSYRAWGSVSAAWGYVRRLWGGSTQPTVVNDSYFTNKTDETTGEYTTEHKQ